MSTLQNGQEHPSHLPPVSTSLGKVPNRELALYAVGSVAGTLGWTINMLTNPIFNMELGVSLVWLGIVIAANRILDGFTDILIGYWSDRIVTRWGRRKPMIFAGGVVMALCYFLLWMFPENASHTGLLVWYGAVTATFYLGTTLFGTGYWALGVELTMDYDERTRVSAWRAYAGAIAGIGTPWLLWIIHNKALFDNPVAGMRTVGNIIAIAIAVTSLPVALFCKERYAQMQAKKKHHISFLRAFTVMLENKEFMRMTGVGLLLMASLTLFEQFGFYINFFYVYGGDKSAATVITGAAGAFGVFCALLGIPLVQFLSKRLGKHIAVRLSLLWMILGSIAKWFLYNPEMPWLQLAIPLFYSIGISAFYTLLPSINADIIDVDELLTGERREAMFGAVGNLVGKIASAGASGCTGFLMVLTGFAIQYGGEQTEETFFSMRLLFSFASAAVIGCALALVWGYSLTPAKMEELQTKIRARRAAEV
jgi:GPH family glycoside/pentoside/hexuronide:cation symporter